MFLYHNRPIGATLASSLLAPTTGPWWTSELHRAPSLWVYEPGAQIFQ
jgi:hypothetical protein